MDYLVYKYKKGNPAEYVNKNVVFKIWTPSLLSFIPKGLPSKYILYWFFHYLHVFRNKNYKAILGYVDNVLVCSLLVVPNYFKWPFMNTNDVQLTYVKTYKDQRGKGYAKKMLNFTLSLFKKSDSNIWYVTDSDNVASQALAKSVGFEFTFFGERDYVKDIKWLKILKEKTS